MKRGTPFRKRGRWQAVWRRFCRNRLAVAGLVLLLFLTGAAVFAPAIADYERVIHQDSANRLIAPCAAYPFGTDAYGRDLFARVIWGSRYSLSLGIGSVLAAMLAGAVIGSAAGFYGGRTDSMIMRLIDMIMAIPGTLLAITIAAALGTGVGNLMIAMSISQIPTFARVVRSVVWTIASEDYVEAAKTYGSKTARLITRQIWPNALGPLIVQASLSMAQAVLTISSLSFIGLGIPAPSPEWGTILAENKSYMRMYGYLCTIPGFAILLSVIALNLIGDGLRDALDPKLSGPVR